MLVYRQPHQYYDGVDLHARSMYLHILDADKRTQLDKELKAVWRRLATRTKRRRSGLPRFGPLRCN
jgi:hypothetical protein